MNQLFNHLVNPYILFMLLLYVFVMWTIVECYFLYLKKKNTLQKWFALKFLLEWLSQNFQVRLICFPDPLCDLLSFLFRPALSVCKKK